MAHEHEQVPKITKAGAAQKPSSASLTAVPLAKASIQASFVKPPSFHSIYNKLHTRFPEIINMNKPVLLAVGIRKEISQAIGVSSVILKKWIAWYCRKSNYYALHKEGVPRFNLDGSEAGVVTERHQEKMDKHLEKVKIHKSLPQGENTGQIDQDSNLTNTADAIETDIPNNNNVKSK